MKLHKNGKNAILSTSGIIFLHNFENNHHRVLKFLTNMYLCTLQLQTNFQTFKYNFGLFIAFIDFEVFKS